MSRSLLVFVLTTPWIANCKLFAKAPDSLGDALDMAKSCPDLASIDAIAQIDFTSDFKLSTEAAAKVKAGMIAAADLSVLAASVDADLKSACGGLAKDLGGGGETFESGAQACKAAMKAMGDFKSILGTNVTIDLKASPPICSASMDAMAECAGKCDASVTEGAVKAKCEGGEVLGECSGKCSGKCDLNVAAGCSGTCEGSCDAKFKGSCAGTCEGKCDGKPANGECKGTCDGKCDAGAKGTCKGKCAGACAIKGGGKCEGACHAKCDVEMKSLQCTGKVEPPAMSADCKASCDAHASAKLSCSNPSVLAKVKGATDAKAALQYEAALRAHLPKIVQVGVGMASAIEGLASNTKATLEGGAAAVTDLKSQGPAVAGRAAVCLGKPLTSALEAAASLQASVKVSVDVKASASAGVSGKPG